MSRLIYFVGKAGKGQNFILRKEQYRLGFFLTYSLYRTYVELFISKQFPFSVRFYISVGYFMPHFY